MLIMRFIFNRLSAIVEWFHSWRLDKSLPNEVYDLVPNRIILLSGLIVMNEMIGYHRE